ncbi:radical SAM protein [Syntrophomonas wolfei]|uniref:radical SAM protein n=1 Tax=Syntrophomonas wolfei TaxID=863 RepID=UPI00077372AB|nr:radical SAM protein [Syntrophomonas wolfei]
MFTTLLHTVLNEGINKRLALKILEESRWPQNALELFAVASRLRDENLGKELYFSAGFGGVLPCRIVPRCAYCTYFVAEPFPLPDLLACVRKVEELGIRQMHLSGGSNLEGYDSEILEMVQAIQETSDIQVEVNLGPSLSADTVKALKTMKVVSITSSLETFTPELFNRTKPGDSLEKRKQLLEICEQEGVPIRSMMMIGLGEKYADRIEQLFYLSRFSHLYHLRFSRFYPYPRTALHNQLRCSPWELARTLAVARLIMPRINLGLAAGNEPDDLPLWYAAGGGNQLLGVMVSNRKVENKTNPEDELIIINERCSVYNRMPLMQRYLQEMGASVISKEKIQ